jgi:hypothetical protein
MRIPTLEQPMTKEKERELLLRRIFPIPYAGAKDSLPLFLILKELADTFVYI